MRTLRIATRRSPLAMWQAEHVAALLQDAGFESEIVPLESRGDLDMRPIDGTRSAGVFTKRIQHALLQDEADVAVHSLKDLPTEGDSRLRLAAVPERENVADALVSTKAWTIEQLPQAARVGTGSRRRGAQLLNRRPDLQIGPIRGNVQTRLEKLHNGEFDAIVLAEAGLQRLKMDDLPRQTLSLEQMLPAPGQGALGIEVRSDDDEAIEIIRALDHVATRAAVTAERHLLAALHGGCLAPIAAHGQVLNDQLDLTAAVLDAGGQQRLDHQAQRSFQEDQWQSIAESLAEEVTKVLKDGGAVELVQQSR